MAERTCTIQGCDAPPKTRGWCNAHYQRWWKTGDPLGIRPGRWDGYDRPTCWLDGCSELAHAAGLCPSHYSRHRRHGDPTAGRRPNVTGTPEERFLALIEIADSGCWLWTGARTTAGYGEFFLDNTILYAHRWSYEHFVGPIPDGKEIDHMCRVHACANPRHLDPVPPAKNQERGRIARSYGL